MGVYGVVSYTVGQRTRELGLRKALGATPGGVLRVTLGRSLRPLLAGVALGLVGAVAGGRLLEGFLYEVPATDVRVLGVVASVLIAAGAAASFVPAVRALRLAPSEALRAD